jgi:hypothetical protein
MSPDQIVDKKTLSIYRFERANKEFASAKLEKENNNYFAANNRAYYAIFHAIRSILALDNVDFKKHSAVIGHFNKNYIATNIFDKKYGSIINNAFELRQDSDYQDFYVVDKNKTEELVINAESFLQEIKKYLKAKQII